MRIGTEDKYLSLKNKNIMNYLKNYLLKTYRKLIQWDKTIIQSLGAKKSKKRVKNT